MNDCGYSFTITKPGEDPPDKLILNTSDLEPPTESYYPIAGSPHATFLTRAPDQFAPPGYSINPVLTDAFQVQTGKELAKIASDPILDGNKMSRKVSVNIIQDKIRLQKTQEDGRKFWVEIFNGYPKSIESVTFENRQFFRIIFIVEAQTRIGKYHAVTELLSVKKVRNILCEELTVLEKRANDNDILFLIQAFLNNLYSNNENDCEPLQFGWFYDVTSNCIYRRELPDELLTFSKFNKNLFLVAGSTYMEPDNLIRTVINSYNQLSNEKEASTLLIFSFTAMLYSLIGLPLTDTVLVLLGNPYSCKRIASHFMKAYVRRDNEDTISLSEDKRSVLQDYLTLLHDDVTIIIDDASSKYDRGKLEDIYKYARSGECKRERIQTLFTICSNELGSLNYLKSKKFS